MSPSFAPDAQPERSHAAASPTGQQPDSLSDEIDAEIADHLAAAAAERTRRGESAEEAARTVVAQFGDVAWVKRQCWWIHKGDEIMFRTAAIALLCLLTLAVVAVAIGGWQVQRNLAHRTEELSEQLASLAATQEAILAQQRPPEITGHCYSGDPSKPAANVELKIFRFSDSTGPTEGSQGVYVDAVRTDALGHFATGPVQMGDYCVIAPLRAPTGISEEDLYFKEIQSRPASVVPGAGIVNVDLDLLATGCLRVEATSPVPETVRVKDGAEVFATLSYDIISGHDGGKPVRAIHPNTSPLYSRVTEWPVPFHVIHGPADRPLSKTWWLPPRMYSFTSSLHLWSVRPKLLFTGGNQTFLGGTYGEQNVKVSASETTTVTIAVPETFPESIKDAVPHPQNLGFGAGPFGAGSIGEIMPKTKLELRVATAPSVP